MDDSDSDTIPVERPILDILEESQLQMTEQTKQLLVDFMVEMGAFSVDDMKYFTDEDLAPFLLPIQRRKLLSCIEQKLSNKGMQCHSFDACLASSSKVVSEKGDKPISQFTTALDYEIKEEKLPSSIMACLNENKRLSPSERRLLIRILTEDILLKFKSPGRKVLRILANKFVLKHPQSLADYGFNEEFLGDGCGSFILQLENSISNMYSRRHMQKRSAESENESDISSKRQGCNMTSDELESYRTSLIGKFQQSEVLNEEATSLLQKSFTGIRSVINSQKYSISALLRDWPILFTKDGLSVHFQQLVGKSIKQFTENLCKTMPNFLMYMQSLQIKNKDIKNVIKELSNAKKIRNDDQPEAIGMIALLSNYFNEQMDTLVIKEGSTNLPVTPCIISKGSTIYTADEYDIAVDKQIIVKDVARAADALAVLFASFYVFDIQYPSPIAVTLEFLQWSIAEIRPRSNKAEKAVKNKSRVNGINGKVITLVNHINDFCAL